MQATNRVKRDLALRDVLEMLRRQRGAVVVVFVLCLIGCGIAFKLTSAVFRTTATLLVQMHNEKNQSEKVDPLSMVMTPASDLDIPTQVQVLQSGEIMQRIYKAAGLGTYDPSNPDAPKIRAAQILETSAISLQVEAADPSTATRVAANIGTVYNAYLVELRQNNLLKALTFLHDRFNRYQNEFNTKMAAVEHFRKARKLVPLDNEGPMRSQRVAQTQADLTVADAQVSAADTKVRGLKHDLATLPKNLDTHRSQPNDPELETQRQLLANLQQQKAQLQTKWKDGSPPIQEINAQILAQTQRLAAIPTRVEDKVVEDHPRKLELENAIADAQISLAAARTMAQRAAGAATEAVGNLKTYSDVAPEQSIIGQAANDAKANMDSTAKNIEELEIQRNSTTDGGALLNSPTPTEKVRPVLVQYLAVAILAAVVIGFLVAMLKDHIEDRVSSPQDVFQICGLEPLAQMPVQPALAAPGSTALTRHQANPELFDSYRLLRFNLLNAAERGYMGSLVVTSVTGAEGKSDLACDLAEVMASGGRRIILVDANLRNPTLATHFGLAERPGLTDVLVGDAPLEDALMPTGIEGLLVLPAGAKTPNPVDLLESSQMVSLHSDLRERADLVIFDAPSCLSYADVAVLSSFTDSVLVVAELGSTKRDLLNRGVQMLQRSSARLIGVVLRDRQLKGRAGRKKAA